LQHAHLGDAQATGQEGQRTGNGHGRVDEHRRAQGDARAREARTMSQKARHSHAQEATDSRTARPAGQGAAASPCSGRTPRAGRETAQSGDAGRQPQGEGRDRFHRDHQQAQSDEGGARGEKAAVDVEGEDAHAGEEEQAQQIGESLGDDDGRVRATGMPRDSRSRTALIASPSLPGVTVRAKPPRKTRKLSPAGTVSPSTLR